MATRLSEAQHKALDNLARGRPADAGFVGRSQRGGLTRVIFGLRTRGLTAWTLEHGDRITTKGRAVLACLAAS